MSMETWTDDDDVTHDMCSIVARCFVDVKSRYAPCKNDDPPRPVTCLHCLGTSDLDRALQAMIANDVVINERKLEEARKLWAMEKVPMGPAR